MMHPSQRKLIINLYTLFLESMIHQLIIMLHIKEVIISTSILSLTKKLIIGLKRWNMLPISHIMPILSNIHTQLIADHILLDIQRMVDTTRFLMVTLILWMRITMKPEEIIQIMDGLDIMLIMMMEHAGRRLQVGHQVSQYQLVILTRIEVSTFVTINVMMDLLAMDQSAGRIAQRALRVMEPIATNHMLIAEEQEKKLNVKGVINGEHFGIQNVKRISIMLDAVSAHQTVQLV